MYGFAVVKNNGEYWEKRERFKKFAPNYGHGSSKAFLKTRLRENAVELVPDDKLTIVCQFEIHLEDDTKMKKNTTAKRHFGMI